MPNPTEHDRLWADHDRAEADRAAAYGLTRAAVILCFGLAVLAFVQLA